SLKLYFLGHPDGQDLSIAFDPSTNSLHLKEEKNYGQHYLPGMMDIDQRIGSSLPISGWAIGSSDADLEKFLGRDLGMGAFINDANLRKYVNSFSGDRFSYAFQIDMSLASHEEKKLVLATSIGNDDAAAVAANANLLFHATEVIHA